MSVIIQGRARSGTEKGYLRLFSYDVLAGTTARDIHLLITDIAVGETFVWNDRFVLVGADALQVNGGTASNQDLYHSYIDQNWV